MASLATLAASRHSRDRLDRRRRTDRDERLATEHALGLQNVDVAGIKGLPGLDSTNPDRRVPESSAEAAWRMAASMTRDDALGVHVAESLPRGAFDLIEYAVRTSGAARSAARIVRPSAPGNRPPRCSLIPEAAEFQIPGNRIPINGNSAGYN
jgi:hypothetical protein